MLRLVADPKRMAVVVNQLDAPTNTHAVADCDFVATEEPNIRVEPAVPNREITLYVD